MGVRGDLQMLETAVRRRFPVDTELAAKAVNEGLKSDNPRVSLRAAQIAAIMESQNQRDEHHAAIIALEEIKSRLVDLRNQSVDARLSEHGSNAGRIANES